ncbi:Zinc carboxypeptidase [bacterium A37T11]|nr:Zinc carboxypeptidase [bacterium A37T11]
MLDRAFEKYREPSITHRRFKHADIEPLILKRKGTKLFKVDSLGASVQGRAIYELSYGQGDKKVMLWSQMHGNEPTATMALMDLFNFLEGHGDGFDSIRKLLRTKTELHFIPMVNPDGTEIFNRRNAMDIDLNRDARATMTPEGKLLKGAAERIKPAYGFNLHDHNIYHNVPGTAQPTTISLLAPAYNYEREVNDVRRGAMQLIVGMNRLLQSYIPGGVARYDDTHTPRGFGDNFQKWGASTVLIESGAYKGDPEKQYIRKLNFMIILNALLEIASSSYTQYDAAEYEKIPFNDSRLSDLMIRGLRYQINSTKYTMDVAIRRDEYTTDSGLYYVRSHMEDIGDLLDDFGYVELKAEGLEFMGGKVYPSAFPNINALSRVKAIELLRQGFYAAKLLTMPSNRHHNIPLLLFNKGSLPGASLHLGSEANFFLARNGKPVYAVINGYLIDLSKEPTDEYRNYVQ